MKKISYITFCLVLFVAMASCYEDKGNYDYHNINDVITIEFDKKIYSVVALEDDLVITPDITTRDNSEDGFTYVWAISKQYTDDQIEYGLKLKIDTISRERNLDWNVALENGMYYLYYRVDNNNTGMSYYHRANVNVTTKFARGFYVLKEIDGNTDLDLFITEGGTSHTAIPDVLEGLHGEPISGKPFSFGIAYQYSYMKEDGSYDATRTLTVATENKEMRVYNTQDMNLIYDHDNLFYRTDIPIETPYYLCGHMFGLSYVSDKGHYFSYQAPEYGMPGAGKFGYPDVELGEMRPNPNVCMIGSDASFIVFDEIGGRLVSYDWNGGGHPFADTGSGGAIMPNLPRDIPHKLLFNGANSMGGTTTGFLIFQDVADPDQRYLYYLQYSAYNNPIKEVRTLPKNSGFNRAAMYAVNEKEALVIYFVYDNKLYMYDISTQEETLLSPTGLGADETITYISNRWYNFVPESAFNHLVIGTSKGSGYKVYLYNTTGPFPNGNAKYVFEGQGKAFSLHYVSEEMNSIDMHGAYSFGRY